MVHKIPGNMSLLSFFLLQMVGYSPEQEVKNIQPEQVSYMKQERDNEDGLWHEEALVPE